MTLMNHLIGSTSPYLLQHSENPVDWYSWGAEALEIARRDNKPIFLSIGYAACHWCHVMAHESFEDETTAAFMNENFVNIKVDREERPDLDGIYMAATMALTGSGGWPMSVFLSPDLRPFYAGTYFPPVPRHNLPSFRDVLTSIAVTWRDKPDEIERVSGKLTELLQRQSASSESGTPFSQELLTGVVNVLNDSYDWDFGGWGGAPKFPQPMPLEYLLRRAVHGDDLALKIARHALFAMAKGGMYDVVGGGFSRYSVDIIWRTPHFEKMLYDNAQLSLAYLHAWQITHEPLFERIVVETLDFVQQEMTNTEGGFTSSLDADSEGVEGKFYVWTLDEIQKTLGPDFEFFKAAYGISAKGNWEGKTILQRAMDDATLAAGFKLDVNSVPGKLAGCHAMLLDVRNTRVRPAADDKVLTAWNGLMLRAFSEASRVLDDKQKRKRYQLVATRNAGFLVRAMRPNGHLRRAWRNDRAGDEVFLEDYGSLIIGLIALYQTDFNNRWFVTARDLCDEMISLFSDQDGGFYDTPNNGEPLIVRPKDLQDNAVPSGNALACEALINLADLTGDGNYRDKAEKSLRQVSDSSVRYPTGFGRWLSAADQALAPVKQIALLYNAGDESIQSFLDGLNKEFRPNIVLAASPFPPSKDSPALLMDRPIIDNKVTAYICEHFVCKLPVVGSVQEFLKQL